jgi:predicted nucleic acid-binding protein
MVVDSDVLIDFFRDYPKAKEFLLTAQDDLKVSRVTVMEVIVGVKTKMAARKALKQLDALGIKVIEVTEAVSRLAGDILVDTRHKFGTGILDSFVAATALETGDKLVTRNIKHFNHIKDLRLTVPY